MQTESKQSIELALLTKHVINLRAMKYYVHVIALRSVLYL